jgi:xylitol oxidase
VTSRQTNWGGNVRFGAERFHRPSTLDELRRVVAGSRRAHALGTRHSFSRVADTSGDLIDVTGLPTTIDLDTERRQVRVSAGTTYGELATYLHERGLALHNLGSLPHISVAGACATGTHGSGDRNGCLATAVDGIELMTADGDVVDVDAGSGHLAGAVLSLGGLGIVTALTLDVRPTYDVTQHVFEHLPLADLAADLDGALAAAYSVSLFTTWRSDSIDQAWLKALTTEEAPGEQWRGAVRADGQRHPIPGVPPAHCTRQGEPGPWHERLPHFRADFTPSSGEEVQSEYLVARHHSAEALAAVAGLRDAIAPVLMVCEVRSVAADDLWLSPAYGRDSVALHFTWVLDDAAVRPVVTALEERLAPFAPRPHWGKLFTMPPEVVRGSYDRAADFVALMRHYDPRGTFRNAMLDEYLPA